MVRRSTVGPLALAATLAFSLISGAVQAQAQAQTKPAKPEAEPQGGASPGSQDDLPTDKPQLRAFCADRPGQGTLPCTVDPGHLQVETDLFNVSYDRSTSPGQETYLFTSPTLKLGVAKRADVELQVSPYEKVRQFADAGSRPRDLYGVGDVTVRYKQNVFGDYRGPLAAAVEPFVKLPTARRGIGDGAYEGGVLIPFAIGVSKALVLNFSPELDVRKDQVGSGVHTEEFGLANVTVSLPLNLGLLLEVAARGSQDPVGAHTQAFSDFALTLALKNDAEIDIGVNHGLNRFTPANQVYVGVGKRF